VTSVITTLIGKHRWRIDWGRSDDLERPVTRVSRSLYTYKSNISKTVRLIGTKLL